MAMNLQPRYTIKPVTTEAERAQVFEVRRQVFQVEQGVSEAEEFDQFDQVATHWIAQDGSLAMGTLRLREWDPSTIKVERMAVLAAYRGQSVGRMLLEAALADAAQQGYKQAKLHAQVRARGFYERLGFVGSGDIFEEAGIPHVVMTNALR